MVLLKTANLTVAFLLELVMLAAFGIWGFDLDRSLTVRWLTGLGVPVLAAGPYGLAAIALAASRHPALGLVAFTAALVSIGLAVLLRQEEVVTLDGATSGAGPAR